MKGNGNAVVKVILRKLRKVYLISIVLKNQNKKGVLDFEHAFFIGC